MTAQEIADRLDELDKTIAAAQEEWRVLLDAVYADSALFHEILEIRRKQNER